MTEHQEALSAEVTRVEEVVSVLADPDAVAQALETAQAESARAVAEANERLARERHARGLAESAEREANEAGNAAWERVEQLEQQLQAATIEVHSLREEICSRDEAHTEVLAVLEARHADEVARLRAEAEAQLADAVTARARAEGAAEQTKAELESLRLEHDQQLERARAEMAVVVDRARQEVGDLFSARFEAELQAQKAAAQVELARAEARAAAASEMATARAGEIARLGAHVDDLRSALARQSAGLQPEGGGRKVMPRRVRNDTEP